MRVIWFGPLVVVFFLAGMTIAAVMLRLGKLHTPRRALAAMALPFGCAGFPVLALTVASLSAAVSAPDDRAIFTELFGPGDTPDPKRMLSDAFGKDGSREVMLRLNATATERDRLLALPGLTIAATSPEDFALRGLRHNLDGWWMRPATPDSAQQDRGTACFLPIIYQADGFNGWRQFRIAFCTGVGESRPVVFVTAYGRSAN